MNRSELLKKQLAEYERKATDLEGIVLKDLNYLEKRKNAADIVILEGKIQSRLRRLDYFQEEIDSIAAELKEAGTFDFPDYSGNVYVYKLPKQPKQKPLKIQVSEARAKYREETSKHKVYSVETTAQAKRRKQKEEAAQRKAQAAATKAAERQAAALRKAQEAAERKAAQADRQAAREAREAGRAGRPKPVRVREPVQPKPKTVRPPQAKPAPRPRKPAESREVVLAKKKVDSTQRRLKRLDAQIEAERINLERRLEERKARVIEVADAVKLGPQKRYTAQKNLENVEQQLADLPKRREEREQALLELIEIAQQEVSELLEKDSQLI